MMATRSLGNLTVDLLLKQSGWTEGWTAAEREADRAQRKISAQAKREAKEAEKAWAEGVAGIGAAVGAVGATIAGGALFQKVMFETRAAEKEQALLEAALRATGNSAGYSRERLNAMAEAMARVTSISAGDFNTAQTVLLGFTNIAGKQLPEALQRAADFATRTGADMKSAAETIGRALDIPSVGMVSLQKQGFKFSESQVEVARNLEKTGQLAEAQGLILKALDETYGGAAVAARDTLGGAYESLQNTINGLLTGDGGSFGELKATLEDLNAQLQSNETRQAFATIVNGIGSVTAALVTASTHFIQFGKFVGEAIGAAVHGAADPIDRMADQLGETGKKLERITEIYDRNVEALARDPDSESLQRRVATSKKRVDTLRDQVESEKKLLDDLSRSANNARVAVTSVTAPDMKVTGGQGSINLKDGSKSGGARGKTDAERDAEAAVKYLENLRDQAALRKDMNAAEKLAYDLENGKVKLSEEQLGIAREYAGVIDEQSAYKTRQVELEKRLQELAKETARLNDMASDNSKLREEIELLGQNEVQQAAINAQRLEAQILVKEQHLAEVARRDDLAETHSIEQANLQYEIDLLRERLALTSEKASRQMSVKAAEESRKAWQTSVDSLTKSLTDQLMEGGRSFGDYLKNLARTLIFRPAIENVVNSVLGPLMGGGGGGGMNLGSLFGGTGSGISQLIYGRIGQSIGLSSVGAGGMGPPAATTAGSAMSSVAAFAPYAAMIIAGMKMSGEAYEEGYRLGHKDYAKMWTATAGIAPPTLSLDTKILESLGLSGKTANMITGASLWAKYGARLGLVATPHMGAGAIYQNGDVQEGSGIYNRATFGMGDPREYAESAQAAISSVAAQIGVTLDAVAVTFGEKAGFSVATAFADDISKDGAWGSLKITDALGKVLVDWGADPQSKWAPREFANGEEGYKQYLAAVEADLLSAVQAMDLPGWAEELFATAEGVEGLTAALNAASVVIDAFEQLGDTMSMFAGISGELQTSLIKASGGMDALVKNANSFYQNFYSDDERQAIERRKVQDKLTELGYGEFDFDDPKARENFRKMVEEQMAAATGETITAGLGAFTPTGTMPGGSAADFLPEDTQDAIDAAQSLDAVNSAIGELGDKGLATIDKGVTEVAGSADIAGKSAADAAAELLGLSDAVAGVTEDAEAAAAAIRDREEAERQAAIDAAWMNFEAASERELTYWSEIQAKASEAISALNPILATLRSNAADLFAEVSGAAAQQAINGQLYVTEALRSVRAGGSLTQFDGLSDAITSARAGMTTDQFGTEFEYLRAIVGFANDLSALGDLGDEQLSTEERIYKAAQAQIDLLDEQLVVLRKMLDGTDKLIDLSLTANEAAARVIALLTPDEQVDLSTNPTAAPGSGPTFGPGSASAVAPSKYSRPIGIPGGTAYVGVSKDEEAHLDTLAAGYHAFDGTGDVEGLNAWIRDNNVSIDDLSALSGLYQKDWEAWLISHGIPSFDVGTNRVPQDMLAFVHKDEAIVPAAYNPALNGDTAASAPMAQLIEDGRTQAAAILSRLATIANTITQWDADGVPEEREVSRV